MKVLRALLTCSILMLPVVAAAQDVNVDFDKAYNFAVVKMYSIKIGTGWNNDLSERRVLAEFDEAIASKGWKKVEESQANVQVLLHGATQTKRDATTFYSGGMGGYGYRYGGMGMGMGTAQTTVNEYRVGSLVVDMFDAKTKALVFRGTASDEISDNPAKNEKKVEKASTKMFKDFPPSAKK